MILHPSAERTRTAGVAAAVFLSVCLGTGIAANEPAPLTLADAVRLALARNSQVLTAGERVQEAELGVRLARSAFLPQFVPAVTGALGQSTLSNEAYSFTAQQTLPFGTRLRGAVTTQSSRNQFGTFFVHDTTVAVTQSLLRNANAARLSDSVRIAESGLATRREEQRAVEQETIVRVAAAYYQVLSHHAATEIAARSVERARSLADAADVRQRLGRVSRLDVLRARQLVAEGESQLVFAQAAKADSLDELSLLLMMDPTDAVSLDYEFRLPDAVSLPGESMREALERRSEVLAGEESVREADYAVNAARAQLRPELELGMAVTRQSVSSRVQPSFGLDGFRAAAIGSFSMPLVQAQEQVRLQSALLERGRRQRHLEELRGKVAQQVRHAIRQEERATRTVALVESAVALSREQSEVAQARYELGLSNNLDVVTAELEWLQAQTRHAAAKADLALTRLQLRQALGVLTTVDVR